MELARRKPISVRFLSVDDRRDELFVARLYEIHHFDPPPRRRRLPALLEGMKLLCVLGADQSDRDQIQWADEPV